jgi:glycerol-3-phosphate acyltransferase PlsY
MPTDPVATLITVLAAYVLGSIPFSFLVARWWGVSDVRRVGSGNVGATNVMRAAGRTAGLVAFVLDALKGAVATLGAERLAPGEMAPPLAAVAAILGHMYPVWLRFRGGKGVATGAGAFLPLTPLATVGGLLAFAIVAAVTRFVSVASCAGAVVLAALAFVLGSSPPVAWGSAGTAALIVWKHRANLGRISRGTESRLGARTG